MENEGNTNGNQEKNEESAENDSVIRNLYISSAKELITNIIDPSDKELSTLWLDFIILHINDVPVIFDYLKLFLFSLHQPERMPPFNDLPPSIDEVKDTEIDVISMGRKMIEAYRKRLQDKNKNDMKSGKKCEEEKESVPLIEFGSSPECKDFFATQRIPQFGRQCYFTSSPSELPFWWPVEPGVGYPRDYLSRLAWFMYWDENKKMSKLDECSKNKNLKAGHWWKEAIRLKKKQDRDSALGFRWHNFSLLPHLKTKLDKKQIQKFFDSVESKGLEVFSIDENAESIKDKTVPDSERITISQTIQDILNKSSHGVEDPSRKFADVLKDHLKEKDYNKGWADISAEDEPSIASESAENFLRKVQENSIKRLLQTSPENINLEDEAKIRQLKQLYCKGRRGEEPPPPSPDEISSDDLLRKGVSWYIPAFKRPYATQDAPPCPQEQKPSSPKWKKSFGSGDFGLEEPCDEASGEFVSPGRAFAEFELSEGPKSSLPSPRRRRRQFSPPQQETRQVVYRQPSPSQKSPTFVCSPKRSPKYVCSQSSGSEYVCTEQVIPRLVCTEQTGSRQASPRVVEMEFPGHVSPRQRSPKFASPKGRESFGFGQAEELDFMDQFLMPTADVEFDEETQDCVDWGGYDDVDDDWTAPPEVEPDEPYEIGLPPVGMRTSQPAEEECDRREGKVFMPTGETRVYAKEELEPIEWPDTEHIYDINVEFPEDDPPFEFLEEGGPCEDFPDSGTDDYDTYRWRDLGLVADQLGFQNFKP